MPHLKALCEHFEAMHEEEESEEEDAIPHPIQPKPVMQPNTNIGTKVGDGPRRNSFPSAAIKIKTGSGKSATETKMKDEDYDELGELASYMISEMRYLFTNLLICF